jgi:phage shock protein A
MSWFTNFSLVIRSSVSGLCERFENPELMLNQLIIDMEEELQRVRGSVAGVIADEIQLGRQVDQARSAADQWQERAAAALRRHDESAARAAMEQKLLTEKRAETLGKEHAKHKEETVKLHRAIRDLEAQIRQARHKRTLLVARLARVDSSRKINDVMKQADSRSAVAQFHRLEQRVERAEALEQAYARLDDRDPSAEALAEEFAEHEHRERLEKELEELKRRVEPNAS